MSHFFKHAPAQDTYQKRFLEAVFHRQNVIAGFPLGYRAVSLYALAAMMGQGMAVAICPGSDLIRRNLEYFRLAGFRFPDVAFLDGTQTPHEERTILQEINRNRVKLLYTTPQRFASLTFLEVLVHSEVTFMVIEEAERLLPAMPGYAAYKKLLEDGLSQLRKLPPIALMIPPLPPFRLRELSEKLRLHPYQAIQCPPLIEPVEMTVQMLFTEHQKASQLVRLLSGNPGRGRPGRLDGTGAVLIQTAFPAQAEKLGASLIDYGFDSVWITHFKKSPRDQALVQEVAATRLNTIVVNAGVDMRAWSPPAEATPRVVFWTPPTGVEDLFMQVFRHTAGLQGGYGDQHITKGLLLYTKEDYQAALRRLPTSRMLSVHEVQERAMALKHLRNWVLSDSCRLQSLAAYYQGTSVIDLPPCGRCDRCQEVQERQPFLRRGIRRALRRWFF